MTLRRPRTLRLQQGKDEGARAFEFRAKKTETAQTVF